MVSSTTEQFSQEDCFSTYSDIVGQVLDYNQNILKTFAEGAMESAAPQQTIFFEVLDTLQDYCQKAVNQPMPILEQQLALWRKQVDLWQSTVENIIEGSSEELIKPKKTDRRFKSKEWAENPLFSYIKQSYLLTTDAIMESLQKVEGLDPKTRHRLEFFARQYVNALSPSNFVSTNPELMRLTFKTSGMNLVHGMHQFLEDMQNSTHLLNPTMTDKEAFKVGENIAVTPGKIVYRNRLFELIQYEPTTEAVLETPLLIVPPWINKYYILDLCPENSFVEWCVRQGQTTFMISWVNPDERYKETGIDDYLKEGVLTAIDIVRAVSDTESVNAVGYCVGGVLLAITNAYLAKHESGSTINSSTYLATMIDTSKPGDIGAFIEESIIETIVEHDDKVGYFDGRLMGVFFNMLRENVLYWNYYVNNYLKGEAPIAFDLLYWNSDCTNISAKCHRFILYDWYLNNSIIKKDVFTIDNVPIDLSVIKTPSYCLATHQDHIALWRMIYRNTQLMQGDNRFVLGESGHIAGIINSPNINKYAYWTHDTVEPTPDEWLKQGTEHAGSWWPDWLEWLKCRSPVAQVTARTPGAKEYPILGDAPGDYVLNIRPESLLSDDPAIN